MKVGVLTGGGDCPGLNAVIRAVSRRFFARGHDVVGIREGWRGLVDGRFEPLGPREVSGLLPRGGTILGTSRTNPYRVDGGVDAVLEHFRTEGLDALVAIDRRPLQHGVDVNGAHRADVRAVAAGDTLLWIDLQRLIIASDSPGGS